MSTTSKKKASRKRLRHTMYTLLVTTIVVAGFLYLLFLRASGLVETVARHIR